MNWKGMHAWTKCKVNFGRSPEKFSNAMRKYARNAKLDSCSVTQTVLGLVLSPGKSLVSARVKRLELGAMDSHDAVARVSDLLGGDNVVYLSISPNHYFTVIPLSEREISILQGFQDSYDLCQWMESRGSGVMPKSEFLMNFFLLFSSTTEVAIDAAKALFAIPGKENDIANWFKNGNIRLTHLGYCRL